MTNLLEPAKAGLLIFAAAILQVTIFSDIDILGGYPDIVLLTLVAIALLRGSIYGACCGFAAGLIVDTANLGLNLLLTLPVYSLVRRLFAFAAQPEGVTEVRLLG